MRVLFLILNRHQADYFAQLQTSLAEVNLSSHSYWYYRLWLWLGIGLLQGTAPILSPAEQQWIVELQWRRDQLKSRQLPIGLPAWLLRGWHWLLRLYGQCMFAASWAKLRRQPAATLALWNGHHLPQRAMLLAAQKLNWNTLYFENGLIPGTTVCDPKGINANNAIPRSAEFYRQYQYQKCPPRNWQLQSTANPKQADLPKRYIFIPLQVPKDSQILLHAGWIKSMPHLVNALDAAAPTLERLQLQTVFKEHPRSKQRFQSLHHAHRFANDVPTGELLSRCDAVIAINSTVGLEAILLGKKVITLGHACYTIPGLVLHANSLGELIRCLQQLPHWEPDEALRLRFVAWLREQYLIPGHWQRPSARHLKAINQRFLDCHQQLQHQD